MRPLILLLTCCLLLPASAHKARAGSVAYTKTWIRQVVTHVVTVNLNDPKVKVSPAVARKGVGYSEGFGSILSRLQPTAAITGTFFCVRSLIPVGDIVIDGKLVNTECVGTAVCFTADNRVVFRDFGPSAKSYPDSHPAIVCSGPKLVVDGNVYLDPRTEGFRDGGIYRRASRAAIGVTKWNKLLLVSVSRPVYLRKLAWIMKELGAVNAVNLDGGSSTALYCKGRVFNHPARRLTNVILVYDSPDVYAKVKPMLAPLSVVATSTAPQGGG